MRIADLACPFVSCFLFLPATLEPCTAQEVDQSAAEARVFYSDAANLQNAGEFDLAAEQWEAFVDRFPKDPLSRRARHYLGVCYLQLARYDDAARIIQKVVADPGELDILDQTYANLGWAYHSLALKGNKDAFAKSARVFAKLVEQFPKSKFVDQALYYLGDSYYLQGKLKEALPFYIRLAEEFPDSKLRRDGLYALGVTYQDLEQHAPAGKAFQSFLDEFSTDKLASEVRMRQAEVMLQTGRVAEAEQAFAILAETPDNEQADYALLRQAYCASRQDRFADAAERYVSLIAKYPESEHLATATMSAGRAFYRAGDFDNAAKWFQRVVTGGTPDQAEAAHWLCRIQLKKQQPEAARQLAEQILTKVNEGPYVVELKLDHADALYQQPEHRAEAFKEYLRLFREQPQHAVAAQALYNASYAAMELGDHDLAIEMTRRFAEAFPNHALAVDTDHVGAESLLLKGEHASAAKAFSQLIAAHEDHANRTTWYLRRATAHYLLGQFQETIDSLKPILDQLRRPDSRAEAQFLTGTSFRRLGKHQEAVDSLQAALRESPKWRQSDEVLLNLARSQIELNQSEKAKSNLQRLIKQQPESRLIPRAYYELGETLFLDGQYNTATQAYAAVIKQSDNPELVAHARFGQAWSLIKEATYDRAELPLTEIINQAGPAQLVIRARNARAICRQKGGNFEGALDDINTYLKSKPKGKDLADGLYLRALCEVGLAKHEAAIRTLTTILDRVASHADGAKVLYELAWAHKELKQDAQASDAFERIATEFPESTYAAEAHYHVGEQLYAKGDYDSARSHYSVASQATPPGELTEKALYKLGWANFQLQSYAESEKIFRRQREIADQGRLADDALFMQAESLFQQDEYKSALRLFQQVRQRDLADEQMASLARLHGAQCASQLKQWSECLDWLKPFIDQEEKSRYSSEAHYEYAWALQNLGRVKDARSHYQAVAETSRDALGAQARFMLGELEFAEKRFVNAVREFRLLMYGFGGDAAPEDVKPWQAKGALEAGRASAILAGQASNTAEKRQYLEAARKYLTFVIDRFPATKEAKVAESQLKKYGG